MDFEGLKRLGITGVLSLCPEYMTHGSDYAGISDGLWSLGIEHVVEAAKDSGRQTRVNVGFFALRVRGCRVQWSVLATECSYTSF